VFKVWSTFGLSTGKPELIVLALSNLLEKGEIFHTTLPSAEEE
jgi:hypothetical protein